MMNVQREIGIVDTHAYTCWSRFFLQSIFFCFFHFYFATPTTQSSKWIYLFVDNELIGDRNEMRSVKRNIINIICELIKHFTRQIHWQRFLWFCLCIRLNDIYYIFTFFFFFNFKSISRCLTLNIRAKKKSILCQFSKKLKMKSTTVQFA